MTPQPKAFPSFDQLPMHEGDPPNSAWGLWGDGPDSTLGSLNNLTDELVLRTIKEEVKTGERAGLNLPLDMFNPPLLGRAGFEQKVIEKNPLVVNDDVITFNTQGSSQWDSLRHFAYQQDKKFYNGTTQSDIHASDRTSIVLFLRTGYAAGYKGLDAEERERVSGVREWCGLGQSRETTEWLWQRQFAAVASDSPGFEVRPPTEKEWHLHPILLAGWGTPLGELFDLDALAELCAKNGRWSFFFTSAPLNYTGAVASPPNATAIM
ncbi:uncharacterized protein ASPGLDRAFT_31921 [Aspergillus glaucus CBS 516.65]|uniref:Cyclase n=1 Tax=Aspergillus glaucus CBS 516.65 TaxID=1160497 RepID=A0A1L9VY09_ASPGL|nr:hypothetical protein ASPGLDRAFT_31921 [Aspergillus glaucus CBS 516.65]OJJ88813.1 hypothetical protein ASPGLDRAFT_31921 [Aspergillus glaucus CBS 516.65]